MAGSRSMLAAGIAMTACAAAALFVPPGAMEPLRAPVARLFTPVSEPVHRAAHAVSTRLGLGRPQAQPGPLPDPDQLLAENQALRVQVLSLTSQLQYLQQLNADRAQLGDLRAHAIPARVTGRDAGARQIIVVAAPAALGEGTPAITTRGFAGIALPGPGLGTLRIRLATDLDSRIVVGFARYVADAQGRPTPLWIESPPALAQGDGRDQLRISLLSLLQIEQAGIRPGDWAYLRDPELLRRFPQLAGLRVGTVASIEPARANPLMAVITIEPAVDLRALDEVLLIRPHAGEATGG